MVERLGRLGAPVTWEMVQRITGESVPGRPHIARAMVEAGHVASEQEAFDRYLGSGRPAASPRPSPDPATAIRSIRAARGVAGLAHPVFSQDPNWSERLAQLPARLDRLCELGLQAIECHYPDATPAITQQLITWATARHLVVTGGSDYHGPAKAPFAPLGQPSVGVEAIEALRALLE